MTDYSDTVTRKAIDSDILRVYPGAVVNIYDTGTSSPLRATAIADQNGFWSIVTLAKGHYDIKVDGIIVRTIHIVKSDHDHDADYSAITHDHDADYSAITHDHDADYSSITHTHPDDETWTFLMPGGLGVDINPWEYTNESFIAHVAGSIIRVKVVIGQATSPSDGVVHLCRGPGDTATALTFASDSVWNWAFDPGTLLYRHIHTDNSPGISLAVDDVLQPGFDFGTGLVSGITIIATFRPT